MRLINFQQEKLSQRISILMKNSFLFIRFDILFRNIELEWRYSFKANLTLSDDIDNDDDDTKFTISLDKIKFFHIKRIDHATCKTLISFELHQ